MTSCSEDGSTRTDREDTGALAQGLVDLGRRLVDLGLVRGTAGNISVADGSGRVACSPSGTSLGELHPDQVSILEFTENRDLRAVGGPRPTKETAIHAALYRRSGGENATGVVVHTHSFHAMQASCLPAWSAHSAIPPYAPYFVMKVGNCPLIPYRHPGDPELGQLMDEVEVRYEAALLAHHGLVLTADTADHAIESTVELEEACRLGVSLSTVPGAEPLQEQVAVDLAARHGKPWGNRAG